MVRVVNPRPFISQCVGKEVCVRLKWNIEYSGTLVSSDEHFNFELRDAQERVGDAVHPVGDVVVRCNNVLFLRKVGGANK